MQSATAIFAGGCFWCLEADFEKLPGVVKAESGYTGGELKNPTYEQVSHGGTGHAESVRVYYDPQKVTYQQLLDYFWHHIDPTVQDRQFCDVGAQYRTAIFYQDQAQREAAEASLAALQKSGRFEHIYTRARSGGDVLPRGGLSPGLLQEESDSLQLLPHDAAAAMRGSSRCGT